MSAAMPVRPIPFDPSLEQVPEDEATTVIKLMEVLHEIQQTTAKDYGYAVRSVHAKCHGVVDAEMEVLADLPPELAQGLFATPGLHPVVMRLSTNPGDVLEDSVSTPRGLAIKISEVPGERLPGSEGRSTQNFVMVNSPAFSAATPEKLLANLSLLAKTTDRAPRAKKALSAMLRGVEQAIESVGGESATLKSLGGHPPTHILGETFYTCVPILYGPYYAKVSIVPVSPEIAALEGTRIALRDQPDALREAVRAFFARQGAEWEVRVQLATDANTMPIEDASVEWDEGVSPYLPVARIRAQPQDTWAEARVTAIDDCMSFNPWHGIAAHRPLGGIMRVRRHVYEASADFRERFNQCPMHG
ncbi:catalase family protein [Cupriavidus plantarum]|uniref:catalase family protein n=1 Tax=Cupriavidus plantarum TaxID=942865 RepID=UPI001B1952E2|nr:catalase family protein [Cupriavidus plantarum]CAG2128495.1 hypothetical protein LMG26296_01404 [Cupriavidus plantarum]SMR66464.1 hypothetical protein SAMN05421735_1348 [Cupriavidus plantarum]